MTHPFETKLSDLENINFDLEEITNDDELEKISGGMMTSMALGEEGGVVMSLLLHSEKKGVMMSLLLHSEKKVGLPFTFLKKEEEDGSNFVIDFF